MLVLTRKKGQKLIINDNIEITIIETRGESVKVGINAPRDVSIFREEIYEEIKKANEQAIQQTAAVDLETFPTVGAMKQNVSADYMKKIQSLTNKLNKK